MAVPKAAKRSVPEEVRESQFLSFLTFSKDSRMIRFHTQNFGFGDVNNLRQMSCHLAVNDSEGRRSDLIVDPS